MKIGFIGLGNLGTPIASNLIERGHTPLLYNRSINKATALSKKGGTVAHSMADLAECDVVFSILSDDAALDAVCGGTEGLVAHMKSGGTHVSMSTILPATAERIAALHKKKGQHYLSAPVFGRPEAAIGRKLNFVISGPASLRAALKPLLIDAGAAGVWDFGDEIAHANVVKLCGNFMIASCLEAIGESIALAEKSSVSANAMWDFFGKTLFNAPVFHNYSQIILKNAFEPAAFSMQLGLKDLKLVAEQAAQVQQSMPLAALVQEHMQQLIEAGLGKSDWSAVATAVSR